MRSVRTDLSLHDVLLLDAATCAACGLLLVLAARPLGQMGNLPPDLLRYAGASLFPIAGFFAWVAKRALHSVAALTAVIGGNLVWVAGSVWLMLGGVVAPSGLGQLFLGAQAAVVLALTVWELRATLRGGTELRA